MRPLEARHGFVNASQPADCSHYVTRHLTGAR